jgi:hypothetical protein
VLLLIATHHLRASSGRNVPVGPLLRFVADHRTYMVKQASLNASGTGPVYRNSVAGAGAAQANAPGQVACGTSAV